MNQTNRVSRFYLLECYYYWGGENKIPVMINTSVDLTALIQNDLAQYISFVQSHLAPLFDFASYSKNSKIVEIENCAYENYSVDIGFDEFVQNAIQKLSFRDLENITKGNALKIEVNREQPSSLNSFIEISEDTYNLMKPFTQWHSLNI